MTVVPIFPPLSSFTRPNPHPHSQCPHCCPCSQIFHIYSLTSLFPFFSPLCPFPSPSGHCQSVPCFHACGYIWLIRLFCSLNSCGRRVEQKTVEHLHSGILHSRKKEGAPTFCNSMDGTGGYNANEISQLVKDKYHILISDSLILSNKK